MSITYNKIDSRGILAEEIISEILFQTPTISEGLVTFEDDIKANTIFTEKSATVSQQAYTSGAPSAAGDLTAFDAIVTPAKVMYYTEFDPETLRFSRFKRDMKPGSWNNFSTEFERLVIGGAYAPKIALDFEQKYWNNATSATKTAVAALTASASNTYVSTQEQAYVASLTAGEYDGLLTKVIYNDSNSAGVAGVGGRIKVVGATKNASNIKAEYDKKFAAIPAEVLHSGNKPYIYVPYADMQLIDIYNNNVSNFRDSFAVSNGKYSFNGLEIKFVPIPSNVALVGNKEHFILATDLMSDVQFLQMEKIAANQDRWFLKSVMTCAAHVQNQKFNVLYIS
ncbi:hypothetical protein ABGT15_04250 [Flavobacterium enshiense]|uniref:hypothetical protein n=1 Tax=Flavobacterium enshiense TaxID=1341165 RepID=UPI00345D8103